MGNDKELFQNINWKLKIEQTEIYYKYGKRGKAKVIQTLLSFYLFNRYQAELKAILRKIAWVCYGIISHNRLGREGLGGLNIQGIEEKCFSFRLK